MCPAVWMRECRSREVALMDCSTGVLGSKGVLGGVKTPRWRIWPVGVLRTARTVKLLVLGEGEFMEPVSLGWPPPWA